MKRIFCILLCVSVLFLVASAICGHLHDCVGEECQICQLNSNLQKLLRNIFLGCFCLSFEIVVITLFPNINSVIFTKMQRVNLVFNKVKLSL